VQEFAGVCTLAAKLARAKLYLTRAQRETMLKSATISIGYLNVLRLRRAVCQQNYATVPL